MEEQPPINIVAVLVATGANFILSFLWYMPLFGKAWEKEMKMDPGTKPARGIVVSGLIFSAIGNFLMAFVFAHNNMPWTFVPGMERYSMAVIIGKRSDVHMAWILPAGRFEPRCMGSASWKLFTINTIYHLVMLFVAATILTYTS